MTPRLQYYNEIVPSLFKCANGKVPNFKQYLKSQQRFWWEILQEIKDLQKMSESVPRKMPGMWATMLHVIKKYLKIPSQEM